MRRVPEELAEFLHMDKSTIYRLIQRWNEHGLAGIEDNKRGRKPTIDEEAWRRIARVAKVESMRIEDVRRLVIGELTCQKI